jgi:hypothetical protein
MKRIDFTNGNFARSAAHYGVRSLACAMPRREIPHVFPT